MKHKLTREEKIVLYVLSNLETLIDKGLVPKNIWKDGIRLKITNNRTTRRALKNFEPTDEEVLMGIESLADEYFDSSKLPRITEA